MDIKQRLPFGGKDRGQVMPRGWYLNAVVAVPLAAGGAGILSVT